MSKPLSGYPGGYKKMRRGYQGVNEAPPLHVPKDPKDRRSRIPLPGTESIGTLRYRPST